MFAFFRSRTVVLSLSVLAFHSLSVACSGKEPAPVVEGTGGTSTSGTGGVPSQSGGALSAGGSTSLPSCIGYEDGFLPRVHAPVCSNCHGAEENLPDFGVAATAKRSCANIGELVRRGVMPPDGSGYALGPEQRTLVADWVALACPQTAAEAAGQCGEAPPPEPGAGGNPATGGTTSVNGTVTIDRAEWDPDKQELRVEGTVDDAQATLTAEFTGRTESLENERGSFRGEFGNVPVKPPSVKVTASSGASATVAVVAE